MQDEQFRADADQGDIAYPDVSAKAPSPGFG
jgi:hypothetical protein